MSILEEMMYITVLIRYQIMCGTSSFFAFNIDGKKVPIIITNKHVINYKEKDKEEITMKFHPKDSKGNPDGNEEINL